MTITLVEGSIGGGKSYFVVNDLLRKYFKFDEVENVWKKTEEHENVAIYTNIDGFHLCGDLNDVIEKNGGLEKFFTEEFQDFFCRQKKHIYVFDEVHEFFPRKWYERPVINFFRRHRHVGCDIYFMTQEYTDICKELQNLHEHHWAVVRASLGLNPFKGGLRYQLLVGGKLFKTITIKKDLRVYLAYKSSNIVKEDRPKLVVLRYYAFLLLFIFFGFSMFYWVFHSFTHPKSIKSNVAVKAAPDVVAPVQVKKTIVAMNSDYVFIKDSKGLRKVEKSKYPLARIGQEL